MFEEVAGGEATKTTVADRAAGAIVGMLVGEALAVGVHWYYDVEKMQELATKILGKPWVDDYIEAQPGRYHHGVAKGDVCQTGQVTQMLIESIATSKGLEYDEKDFCERLDKLLETLDGTRYSGRYTAKDMCDVYRKRVEMKLPWGKCGSEHGDTTDGMVRATVMGARYGFDLSRTAALSRDHSALHYESSATQTMSMSFGILIGAIVQGLPFDARLGAYLRELAKSGELPFSHAISPEEKKLGESKTRDTEMGLPEPDSLLLPSMMYAAAQDPDLQFKPAYKAAKMFGAACAWNMVTPGAYYLAGRFPHDFESGVLNAVNGGGQNLARASLVGAILGAVNGLSGIPERFVKGLHESEKWVAFAKSIGEQCQKEAESATSKSGGGGGTAGSSA